MDYPAFFTVTGRYQSFADDANADLAATVTFTPMVKQGDDMRPVQIGDTIVGFDTAGGPIGFVLAPIVALIDTDGVLKLRSIPDLPLRIVETFDDLPEPGLTTNTYKVDETGLHYLWDADTSEYVQTWGYVPVRLLADNQLLGLDGDLHYSVQFTDVKLNAVKGNGVRGTLSGFTFRAPGADIEMSLIELSTSDGNAMRWIRWATVDGDLVGTDEEGRTWTKTATGEVVRLFSFSPGEHTDYTIGWDNRLAGDDDVASADFELVDPVDELAEVFSPTSTGYNTQVWVRGTPDVGSRYEVACIVNTVMGRWMRQVFVIKAAHPAAASSPDASEHAYITPSPDRYWRLPANPTAEDVLL